METFTNIVSAICIIGIISCGITIFLRRKDKSTVEYSEDTMKKAEKYRQELIREQAENDKAFSEYKQE